MIYREAGYFRTSPAGTYPLRGHYPYIRLNPHWGLKDDCLLVPVTCAWAVMGSAREQEKPEAKKLPHAAEGGSPGRCTLCWPAVIGIQHCFFG